MVPVMKPDLGGIVRQVIPSFRISDSAIQKDAALLYKMGVEVRTNTAAPSLEQLEALGYTHILLAVGAWKPGRLDISALTAELQVFRNVLANGTAALAGRGKAVQ